MEEYIKRFLEKYNLMGRIIPSSRLGDLEKEYNILLGKGLLDRRLVETYLKNFYFRKPEGLKRLNSVMVFSMARPAHRLGVEYKGEKKRLIIPPTYVDYQKLNKKVLRLFKDWMKKMGFQVFSARLPLKLLSVRSGLAKYGKNNISYIGKWGSFHQLFGFYSDLKTDTDNWQDMKALDACSTCRLCIKSCPTGAIKKDRFLLDAARCLTFLNESEEEMPAWVNRDAHNSLVGCMRCQDVCPYDSRVKEWIEDIGELDSRETELLLDFVKERDKDSPIIEKAKELGLYAFFLDVIPRNLKFLL